MTVIDRSARSDCIGARQTQQGLGSSYQVLDWSTRSDFLVASRARHQSTYGRIQSNNGAHPKLVPSKKPTSLRGFGDEVNRLNDLPELSAFNNFEGNPREKHPCHIISSNKVIASRRTSCMTNLTDTAVKEGQNFDCQSTLVSSPKANIPRQIPLYTLQMLKHKEQMLLKNKNSHDNSFSPSISTFATSNDGSRKMLGKIHPIPSNRSIKNSSRDLGDTRKDLEVNTVDSVEINEYSQCGTCRKAVVVVGLFALLLGIGFGGYFVFLHTEDETDNNKEAPGTSDLHSDASTPIKNNYILATPPTDLEARCSASNLPGSLSECLISCLPSACCYPDFTGETFSDNDMCLSYKPHCDVIFDPWSNGPEGVLRDVMDDILDKCIGLNSDSSKEESLLNMSTPISDTSDTSFAIKRLRGQHTVEKNDENQSGAEQTCQQYCTAAKCCYAPIILDPSVSGLVISRYGVYTDALSSEYVMTNCQISNTANVEMCLKYRELCPNDEELEFVSISTVDKPSTSPSLEPTEAGNQTIEIVNSSSVSALVPTPSPNQSVTTPTSTPHPSMTTQSPISPTTVNEASAVQESCASEEATLLIRTGDLSVRARCMQACLEGLCCLAGELEFVTD